ncbi:MAG: RsmF rRNA methyltransferase first C-terminal domain-containing protein [Thermoflexales bacterium]|nr:RsmF rRNA methyltransferase first C-terminal domain-containing protein [Thermoflexales bacterium]
MPFPPLFLQRMAAWLGPEFPAFLEALQAPHLPGLRVNSLKISPADFQARSPLPLQPVPWCPEGFVVPEPTARPGIHPYHEAGLYYLQDPAAMLAAPLLSPQPGEWVLDLCAAPGGKTTHLAARMQNLGVLVANEIHPRRVRALAENLDRCGVTHAMVLNETPERLAARWEGLFDRVLVDAPCSGEGMFGKEEAAARDWSEKAVQGCARRQSAILEAASRLVRPGGHLLYATCTFAPEENEGVLGPFLRTHPDFELLDVRASIGPMGDTGHPEWIGEADTRLKRALRLWPHRGPGRGHFYALLRRAGDERPHRPRPRTRLPGRARTLYNEFVRQTLQDPPPDEGLLVLGHHLYRAVLPPEMWEGLRVFRPGWLLGQVEETAFVPSRALAMGIRPEAAQQAYRLELTDPALSAFLRGETIPGPDLSGWVLVTLEEFPLGWARATRRGLRR